ncbi:MAG: hypothetical protein Ct9H90mP13_02400 [Pseudomonadota bacterium]|nr:MAG: hypothetical protein Ct9H90mP13_02400 [Pseudomonadota bacterium]
MREQWYINSWALFLCNKTRLMMPLKVFKQVVDLNVLSNSQHQSTQFNLASLYGSQEKWDLAIETLMKFYIFEKEPFSDHIL